MSESLKITFVGTSHGAPDLTRDCSSTLLTVGDRNYFIDGGAPTAEFLSRRGMDFNSVKAFFNTHFHGDHILGSLTMFSLISWFYKDAGIDVYLPEQRAVDTIRALLIAAEQHINEDRLRLHAFDEHFVYDDGALRLSVIPNWHLDCYDRPSYSFVIEACGKRVVFTGDMCHDLCDFPGVAYEEPLDLLVTECAHCTIETLAEKITDPRFKAKAVAVNHINPIGVREPTLLELAKTLPFPLTVPHDGDEIVL